MLKINQVRGSFIVTCAQVTYSKVSQSIQTSDVLRCTSSSSKEALNICLVGVKDQCRRSRSHQQHRLSGLDTNYVDQYWFSASPGGPGAD